MSSVDADNKFEKEVEMRNFCLYVYVYDSRPMTSLKIVYIQDFLLWFCASTTQG